MSAIELYLPLLLPPLLGALIGYITNYIAIRMLFRPLREKRLFGIRLPFTPGIIPRQREALAESIGRMVSTQLITEQTVRSHLGGEEFRTKARVALAEATGQLLKRAIDSGPLKRAVRDLLYSNEGSSTTGGPNPFLTGVVDALVETFCDLKVDRFLSSGKERRRTIEGLYSALVEGPLRDSLKEAATGWTQQQLDAGATMGVLISDDTVDTVVELVNRLYDKGVSTLMQWLRQPEVLREMERRGRWIVRDVLERLTVFQRLLVSAAQYDRRLDEEMPAIVEDLIVSLEEAGGSPENREMVLTAVRSVIERVRETSLDDAVRDSGVDPRRIVDRLVDRTVDLLDSEATRSSVVAIADRRVEGFSNLSVLELFGKLFREEEGPTKERLRRRILEAINAQGGTLLRIMDTLLDRLHGATLEKIVTLQPSTKNRIDAKVADALIDLIQRHLPSIVAALDVSGLVVNRINSLDVEQVEQLLLMVIAKHLKWINLFAE